MDGKAPKTKHQDPEKHQIPRLKKDMRIAAAILNGAKGRRVKAPGLQDRAL
jgi:hypothetical protein